MEKTIAESTSRLWKMLLSCVEQESGTSGRSRRSECQDKERQRTPPDLDLRDEADGETSGRPAPHPHFSRICNSCVTVVAFRQSEETSGRSRCRCVLNDRGRLGCNEIDEVGDSQPIPAGVEMP